MLGFVATIVLVTASGALAPGPLFFSTISHGVKAGARSGLIFSLAHALIEFALIILFALGLFSLADYPHFRFAVGVAGGIFLLFFGAMQIRDSAKSDFKETKLPTMTTRKLALVGLALTGLNPFFILWWLTVGANLILLSLEFASFAGVVFMYFCHVWIDIVWLTAVSHLARMGANVAGQKWYRILTGVFGVVLIYFGATFIVDSVGGIAPVSALLPMHSGQERFWVFTPK